MQHRRTFTAWLVAFLVAWLAAVPASAQDLDIAAEAESGPTWLDRADRIEVLTEGKGWMRLRFWEPLPTDQEKSKTTTSPAYKDMILVGIEGLPHAPLSAREKAEIELDFAPTEPASTSSFNSAKEGEKPLGPSPFDWVLVDEEASQAVDAGLPVPNPVFQQMRATYEDTFTFNEGGEHELWNYNGSAFSGNLTANVPISGSVHVFIRYKYRFPTRIKVEEVRLDGHISVDGNVDLTGEVSASRQFSTEHRLFSVPLYKYKLLGLITLVEVVLDSHVGFDASARISGELGVSTNVDLSGSFDYHCVRGTPCTSTTNFTDNLDTNVTVGIELEAEAKGWARARIWGEVVDDDIFRAEVAARGWIGADLWGYYGNTCGDADGDGTNEWVQGLAAGARAGFDVAAGIEGLFGDRQWPLVRREFSLGWWDLLGTGGSTALSPMISGPGSVTAGQTATYNVKMRPCYPYDEAVTIAVTPNMSGSRVITNPPSGSTALSHSFASLGQQTITVLAASDAFGRNLQVPIARDIQVTAAAQAPTIVSHPDDRAVGVGSTATFSVSAVGTAPFDYQWKRNGIDLTDGGHFSGAESAQLTVSNVGSTVTGTYSVVVSNAAGSTTSNTAQLSLATGGGGGGGGGGGQCQVESFQVYSFPSGLPRVQWQTDCADDGPISVQVLATTVGTVPAGCELDEALWSASTDGNRTVDFMAGGYHAGCPAVTAADFHVELIDTANGNALIEATTSRRATYNPPTLPCDITGFDVTNRSAGELPLITWSTTCPDPGPVSVQVKTTTSSPTPAGCEVDGAIWAGDKNGSRTPDYMAGGYGNSCPAVTESWFWVELWQGDTLIRRTSYELARYQP